MRDAPFCPQEVGERWLRVVWVLIANFVHVNRR
jgi:hypothetical protein